MGEAINNINIEWNTILIITNTNLALIGDRVNNGMNNEINASTLGTMGAVIKNMDKEPTISEANNDIDVGIDVGIFIGEAINKIDVELNIAGVD